MDVESIALVDLSYLFKVSWHGAPRDAAPGHAAQVTLDKLASVRESVGHVIICCDSPPYRRKEIDPNYKAQREKPTDEETSQKRWLMDRIEKDGYQIARAKGYEADDIIATLSNAYQGSLFQGFSHIRIVGSDKDCAQCVTETCRMYVPAIGNRPAEVRGPAEVKAKYGVYPKDMGLFLALVGDGSDNIKGVPGIGPKKAAELITNCGSMVGIAEALAVGEADGAKPSAMWKSLAENWEQLQQAVKLTRLEYDAPVDAVALLQRKEAVKLVEDDMGDMAEMANGEDEAYERAGERRAAEDLALSEMRQESKLLNPAPSLAMQIAAENAKLNVLMNAAPTKEETKTQPTTALARTVDVTEDLQPTSIESAWRMAKALYNGRLYAKYPSADAIFTIIVKARELGLKMTAALDGFHIIEGRPSASADMMRALAERHPDCEYFMFLESTDESATWETKHRRHPKPRTYTYTIDQAKRAGLNGGNWAKRPRDMLTKTAASKLARLVYPGATVGLYSPEEMGGEYGQE